MNFSVAAQIAINPDIAEVHRVAYGARKSTSQTRANDELVKKFNGLADHAIAERWELIEILRRCGHRIGLGKHLINHLDYIMKRVPAEEWKSDGCPVFYQSVTNQAKEQHVDEKTIRNWERSLSDLGLLAFHDSSNGRRFPIKCPRTGHLITAFGVSLIPLMMRADELRQYDYEERQSLFEWRQKRVQINALRRRVTTLIDAAIVLNDDLVEKAVEWASVCSAIRAVRAGDSLNVLDARMEAYEGLEKEILEVLSAYEDNGKNCGLSEEYSATAEIDSRHIDTNTESNNSKGYYSNPLEDKFRQSSPNGSQVDGLDVSKAHAVQVNASKEEACVENRTGKRKNWKSASELDELKQLSGAEYLSPQHIYDAACRKFRFAVDIVTNNAMSKDLTVNDIKLAGEYLSSSLAISPYTWKNANQVLGRYAAAIGIMLACRPHIINAGAYLNGLITKQQKGQLHLHRSIFGQLPSLRKGRLQ